MKIGIDLDGVLVNFTDPYAEMLTKESGFIFPKNSSEWPTTWYWEREAFEAAGVPKAQSKVWENNVWARIKGSTFWQDLPTLPGAMNALAWLDYLRGRESWQIYFITTRPGQNAKIQSENWLKNHGFMTPTVLIAENEAAKGTLAAGLGLDIFIDDKPGNCEAVANAAPKCRVYLVDAPYNRDTTAFTRITSVTSVLALEENVVRAA